MNNLNPLWIHKLHHISIYQYCCVSYVLTSYLACTTFLSADLFKQFGSRSRPTDGVFVCFIFSTKFNHLPDNDQILLYT